MTTTRPARTETVQLRGLPVEVAVHGVGGVPVLLLSGGAAGCTSYFPGVVAGLPDHTVVVHDRLGTGRSPRPPQAPTVRSWSEDVVTLLDALKIDKAVLVGHSLGGALVAQVLVDAPERVAAALLLDPTPINDAGICSSTSRSFGLVAGVARIPLLGQALLRGFVSLNAPKGLSAEAQESYRDTLTGDWVGDTGRAVAGLADDARAFTGRTRAGDAPVLMVVADRKKTSKAYRAQERLAAQLGSELELWPDTRHELHLQQPLRVVERIRSLIERVSR